MAVCFCSPSALSTALSSFPSPSAFLGCTCTETFLLVTGAGGINTSAGWFRAAGSSLGVPPPVFFPGFFALAASVALAASFPLAGSEVFVESEVVAGSEVSVGDGSSSARLMTDWICGNWTAASPEDGPFGAAGWSVGRGR